LITGRAVTRFVSRVRRMRWPVDDSIGRAIVGAVVASVGRRAKCILVNFEHGTLLLHLGMSGSLRVMRNAETPQPHDHFDIEFGECLIRMHDPRRFGGVLWIDGDPEQHDTFRRVGLEPLSPAFSGLSLYDRTRGVRRSIKQLLIDQDAVCGVGNIYASESLFRARIHPQTRAERLSKIRCFDLADAIRSTLLAAIHAGGTTLQDFRSVNGELGEFQSELCVYGREGGECPRCGRPIRMARQGKRSSFYCASCQH
jgi:formamidopyrimidine-DNA glycosylase